MKILLVVFLVLATGCGSKKIVAKNCEKAGNADIFVCDKF